MRSGRAWRRSAARRQRGERSAKLAEPGDPRVRNGGRRAARLAEVVTPIDPDRADARRARAGDVARETVADDDRLIRRHADPVQGALEDPRVRLADAELAGDHDRAESRRERRAGELLALHVRRAVRHQRETVIALEVREHGLGFGVDDLIRPTHGAVVIDELVHQRAGGSADGGERAGPDRTAERRSELAQRTQPRSFSIELAPQPLAPPHADRIGVREGRRRAKERVRGASRDEEHRLGIDAGALRREVARMPQRAFGRLVLHDQRVVEIEEDAADHGAAFPTIARLRRSSFAIVNNGVPKRSCGGSLVRRNPIDSYSRIAEYRNGVVLRYIRGARVPLAKRSSSAISARATPRPRASGSTAILRT